MSPTDILKIKLIFNPAKLEVGSKYHIVDSSKQDDETMMLVSVEEDLIKFAEFDSDGVPYKWEIYSTKDIMQNGVLLKKKKELKIN